MTTTRRSSRAGFTLVELVIVVVIIGAMLAIGLPRFRTSNIRSEVRGALDVIAAMHAQAKQAAVQRSRVARLVMNRTTGTIWVVASKVSGAGVDTVGNVQSLNSRFGVTLSSSPTRDTLTFTPRGLGIEANATLIIATKSSFADTISISSAGRLTR